MAGARVRRDPSVPGRLHFQHPLLASLPAPPAGFCSRARLDDRRLSPSACPPAANLPPSTRVPPGAGGFVRSPGFTIWTTPTATVLADVYSAGTSFMDLSYRLFVARAIFKRRYACRCEGELSLSGFRHAACSTGKSTSCATRPVGIEGERHAVPRPGLDRSVDVANRPRSGSARRGPILRNRTCLHVTESTCPCPGSTLSTPPDNFPGPPGRDAPTGTHPVGALSLADVVVSCQLSVVSCQLSVNPRFR